jgi:integrase
MTWPTWLRYSVVEAATTARIRRRAPVKFDAFKQGRLPLQRDERPAAQLPGPHGDLTAAGIEDIVAVSVQVWGPWRNGDGGRQHSLRRLLTHLADLPGDSWQQRWIAAGLDRPGRPVSVLGQDGDGGGSLTHAASALFALRVITPSVSALRSNRFLSYADTFRIAQHDPALDELFAAAGQLIEPEAARREALTDVAYALTSGAVALAGLTPGGFLGYVLDCRTHVVTAAPHRRRKLTGHQAWELLCRAGHFPPGTPGRLTEAVREPRLTPAQLVDRHDIGNANVRQLIVDYLSVRCAEMDYSSLRTLASCLAGLFWKQVEILAPGQRDLHLTGELYDRWREAIRRRADGKPRGQQDPILLAVRSFYYDLAAWALQEPGKWAAWVAPCPVPQRELRGAARRRRRVSERVADRTRQRQPLLPRLVEQVEHDHGFYAGLLRAGEAALPGEPFTAGGRSWVRVFSEADARREREHGRASVRLRDTKTAEVVHVSRQEERTFWEWAIVQTLRHSGVRIEELLELSQLSIRQYRRPNGEVIALLVIAPSKTDRERVIPLSAELFAVIAAIIRRLTRDGGKVPVVPRYDPHERETSAPQPFLFQRRANAGAAVIAPATVVRSLQRLCTRIAETDPAFAGTVFTPHDFRRILATELVNSGLPIHIGAALLGHLNVQTTRGYVNSRELHQLGEKSQVSRSQWGRNSVLRLRMAAV